MLLLESIVYFSLYLLLCSAENPKYTGFFCKDYIGSNAQTWKNLTQDAGSRYIIIKLKSDDLIDLERASKICRQCHDAQVISHLDASKLSHTLFPAWINVTARISGSSDKTKNVTWTDYASLGNFTNNDIEWIHWLSNQSHIYALLAIPPSRDSDIRRWAALPQEKSYYDPATRQISMDIFVVKSAICQRPIRKSCHYWITEGERCVFHTKFGCHTYIDFMSQAPDDADNGNVCSKARRTVKRCPLAKCSCSVTPWNDWSLCDEAYFCTTSPSNRTRYRQVVEPCPVGSVHENLNQSEPCPLPENCHSLLKDYTLNDSLILRGSKI